MEKLSIFGLGNTMTIFSPKGTGETMRGTAREAGYYAFHCPMGTRDCTIIRWPVENQDKEAEKNRTLLEERLDAREVEFERGELPKSTQIIVLKSAL